MVGFIFLFHYIADFLFQSRMMGENKSSSLEWLLKHVIVYATILGLLVYPFFSSSLTFVIWIVMNFCLHLITDFITSKISTYFYLKKNMYGFWNTIRIDQTIHIVTLYYTFIWVR